MKIPFSEKHILLGVTGSIAAYKAADLASKLTQAGAQVTVVLTASALQFITPLTFQSVTGVRAYTDADLWGSEGHIRHIALGTWAELVVIAPLTANTLAKMAHGIADNLLTITTLAARCPVLIAPAMDGGMYGNIATQENLDILRRRGIRIVGPAEGRMASGLVGLGRMVEPSEILGNIRHLLAQNGPLMGKRVVVTAGGTAEPIDPVRVITNRSSGKQGYALAQAALDLGADVTLISAPCPLATPTGAQRIDVQTAGEMLAAVLKAIPGADALLMAAAVADFQPSTTAANKLKKEEGIPQIHLRQAPDILKEVAGYKAEKGNPRVTVGFAAESQNLLQNAAAKLAAKHLDLIVANDILSQDSGFSVDNNRVTLIGAHGESESLPLLSKDEVAQVVLERVVTLLGANPA